MKAIVCTRYGSPDVLEFKEVEKPLPKENQVLVQVYASSANPLDWHEMRGAPFLVRLGGGLRRPNDPRLGADLAGRVEAIGSAVTQFQVGDEVFGANAGGFAEYAAVPEMRVILKPAKLSFEEAAAVPVAAITALQGLRHRGQVQPGQQVLVNGAAGGVGSFAVQLAKAFGAEVTGVCSTRNLEMVRSIGADHVIDYTQEDFTRQGKQYDVILDAAGNRSVAAYKRALKPKGRAVIVGFTNLSRMFEHIVWGPLLSRIGNEWVGLMGIAKINQEDLMLLKELLEAGKVIPLIKRRYPLCEAPEAIRHLETGHAQGKVIITVEQNSQPSQSPAQSPLGRSA
jgi:NADPH:quinone reductase-like Zn-dependent oxidoreductase